MMTFKEVKSAFIDKLSPDQVPAFLKEMGEAERGDARHKVVNKYEIHLSPEERKGVEEFFAEGNKAMDILTGNITNGTKEDFLKEFMTAVPGDPRHKVVNKYGIHLNADDRKVVEDFFAKADIGIIAE